MQKYAMLPEILISQGIIEPGWFFFPEPLNIQEAGSTHCDSYLNKLQNGLLSSAEQRGIGFPFTNDLLDRELRIVNGTWLAAREALNTKISFTTAGGTHHAQKAKGEGFCVLNDLAVTANLLMENKEAGSVLVIDLDVHQGNGTAGIFENNSCVFTFSMHGEHNYPLRKSVSDLDVELPDGTRDRDYLQILRNSLDNVLNVFKPDFILYQAGVDVLETDKLGRLSLTPEGCNSRDKIVFETARNLNVPVCVTMGGGYSPDVSQIVRAHAATFEVAADIYL